MTRSQIDTDQIQDGTIKNADVASNAQIAVSKIDGAVPSTRKINNNALSQDVTINHNDLPNIQGGQSGEYYHLTSSQYTNVTSVPAYSNTHIQVKNTSTQTITGGVTTLITFPTEVFDSNSEFSSNTFTSKSNQTVLVSSIVYIASGMTNNKTLYTMIYKNGTLYTKTSNPAENNLVTSSISIPVPVSIGDTLNIYCKHTDATQNLDLDGSQILCIEQLL